MLIPISDLCKLPLIPNLVQALSCNSEEESAIVVVTVGSSLINVDNVEVTHVGLRTITFTCFSFEEFDCWLIRMNSTFHMNSHQSLADQLKFTFLFKV